MSRPRGSLSAEDLESVIIEATKDIQNAPTLDLLPYSKLQRKKQRLDPLANKVIIRYGIIEDGGEEDGLEVWVCLYSLEQRVFFATFDEENGMERADMWEMLDRATPDVPFAHAARPEVLHAVACYYFAKIGVKSKYPIMFTAPRANDLVDVCREYQRAESEEQGVTEQMTDLSMAEPPRLTRDKQELAGEEEVQGARKRACIEDIKEILEEDGDFLDEIKDLVQEEEQRRQGAQREAPKPRAFLKEIQGVIDEARCQGESKKRARDGGSDEDDPRAGGQGRKRQKEG